MDYTTSIDVNRSREARNIMFHFFAMHYDHILGASYIISCVVSLSCIIILC